jgi:RNA polymerase sigma-70 factor (ECF subfamily)
LSPTLEIILAHGPFLRRLSQSLVSDQTAAEDLVQETLRIAIERPPRSTDRVRAWLSRVMRRQAINQRRAEAARESREEIHPTPTSPPPPVRHASEAETVALLQTVIRGLEPIYRDVLVLRFYDDLPPRKIARKLRLPVETVNTRLKRGLAQLRERLSERYGDRRTWALALMTVAARRSAPRIGLTVAAVGAVAAVALVAVAVFDGRADTGRAVATARERAERPPPALEVSGPVGNSRAAVAEPELAGPAATAADPADPVAPTSLDVTVRVRDVDGAPVAGADVWTRSGGTESAVVARTDVHGEARLEQVPVDAWVAASMDGRRASLLVKLDHPSFGLGSQRDVAIDLKERIVHPLRIVVRDELGRPVPEALVRVEPKPRPLAVDGDRYAGHRARRFPANVHTGDIELRDLSAYMYLVTAEVPGRAPARVQRFVRPGAPSKTAELTLGPGRTVAGIVRDDAGARLAGARVRVDPGFPFETVTAMTGADGSYRLENLPEAELALAAFARAGDRGWRAAETLGRDVGSWNPRLERGGLLTGRVLRADGEPARAARVELRYPERGDVTLTDERGEFAFEGFEREPTQIAVLAADGAGLGAIHDVSGRSRVEVALMPRAAGVRGTLSVPVGRRVALWVQALDWYEDRPVPFDGETGRYALTNILPGRYEFLAWDAARPGRTPLAEVELVAGAALELDLAHIPPGRLEVRVDGRWIEEAVVRVHDAEGEVVQSRPLSARNDRGVLSFELPAGTYQVQYDSHETVSEMHPVALRAGEVEPLEFHVGRGRPVLVAVALPEHLVERTEMLDVSIRDVRGVVCFETDVLPQGTLQLKPRLAAGSYTVELRFQGHLSASAGFDVLPDTLEIALSVAD